MFNASAYFMHLWCSMYSITAYELYTNEQHDAYDNIRITHAYEHKIITRNLCRQMVDQEMRVDHLRLCYGKWSTLISTGRQYASLQLYQVAIMPA